ncbi:M16 family metallopeptidase [Bradyrhizobium sp. SZCCHNRI1029]|uniref:M16 family metallopeptidase n=1 Tax=Bradyrhizobium sp. SZCCHNRI1029 TaxID=3057278 RepID=UPI00291660EF|nr:insulinase family protein [Bradyrhizobium sp. SZCCHNRI1029]
MRLAVVLVFCLTLVTAAKGSEPPASIPGLQSLDQVVFDNGLHVLVGQPVHRPLFSEVLVVVRAGTAIPAVGKEEVAWIAAQALLAGSRSSATATVRQELAWLGVSTDFTVGREVAVFRFALPDRSAPAFLQLLGDLISRDIPPSAWGEAVARRAQEIAGEQADPWQRGSRQLGDLVWQEADKPVGRDASTAVVDRPTLADFRRRTYSPANMVVSVLGNLPSDELIAALKADFGYGRSAADAPVAELRPLVRHIGPVVRCLQDAAANPAVLLIGMGATAAGDSDFYGWQLVAHILGASYNSRLQRRLRSELQAVYTVEASVIPVGEQNMLLRIVGQTDQLQTVREVVRDELSRLRLSPAGAEELKFARALMRSRLWLDAASLHDQFYRLSLIILSHQRVRDPAAAEALLAAFTPESLQELMRRTLNPDTIVTVALSSRSESLCEGIDAGTR